jgi:hypothetical protein
LASSPITRPARAVALGAAATLLLSVSTALAGVAGRVVSDSGWKQEPVFAETNLRKNQPVFVRITSRPAQPIYGTYSVNCLRKGLVTVYHRDGAWDGEGTMLHRVKLTAKRFRWCHVSPLGGLIADGAVGEVRVQILVKGAPRRR